MGVCVSQARARRAAKRRSDTIDDQLKIDRREYYNTIKILLLGANESGKSTIVKQMKIIHGDGYSQQELVNFTPVIYSNVTVSMWLVVNVTDMLGIAFANPVNQDHAQTINSLYTSTTSLSTLPREAVNAFEALWADGGFQECFRRGYEYQLNDSAPYYFENLPRLLAPGYVPNEQDALRSRVVTIGITETAFQVRTRICRMVEVGGSRSEQRKWIHCFDDARAVLFVCALNGYDMTLFEDGPTNRLKESLNLFQAICNNRFFLETDIILFLNKLDLFRDKIQNSDRHLRLHFPQYTGPDRDVDSAAHFIRNEFIECNLNKSKIMYAHFTTATDTSNIKFVFQDVLETILMHSLDVRFLL